MGSEASARVNPSLDRASRSSEGLLLALSSSHSCIDNKFGYGSEAAQITSTVISSGVGWQAELFWPRIAPSISSQFGQEQNFLGNKLGRQIDDPRSPVRPNYEFPARFTKGAVA